MNKHVFYLVYSEERGRPRLSFNIGGVSEFYAVATVNGRVAREAFPGLVSLLARYGAAWPDEVSDRQRVYVVRVDYAPIIGAYMLTLRRARDINGWLETLEKLIREEIPGLSLVLPRFLEIAIYLAKAWGARAKGEKKAQDTVAATIQYFIKQVMTS